MSEKKEKFNQFRQKMNQIILKQGDLNTKRFFNLDQRVYEDGQLSKSTKELLGLTASLVLRCDDCISYHIFEAWESGWSKEELYEAMNVALIVGGSIVIPHLRRAAELLEELDQPVEFEADLQSFKKFKVYTDGSCLGNPGPGGYAAYIIFNNGEQKKVVSGALKDTTNNQMELKAVIEALKVLPANSEIELYSDSAYVLNGLSKWLNSWKNNNWLTAAKKEVANKELWQELDQLAGSFKLSYQKVKGHSGDHYNEKADKLAQKKAAEI